MKTKNILITKIIILLVVSVLLTPQVVRADGDPPRSKIIEVVYTEYEWWLVYWQDGTVACSIYIDHDQTPTDSEIFYQCGEKFYDLWMASAPCLKADSNRSAECSGMYLFQAGSQKTRREMKIELPTPRVWVDLQDCVPVRGTELCADIPSFVVNASEPLPNESIKKIQGTINGNAFLCFSSKCEVPLQVTTETGVSIDFWAESSFGDSTSQYKGRIRVSESINEIPFTYGWRVEIVSEMNELNTMSGCAQIWESFPPLGTAPDWLANPQHTHLLETNEPYTYLAGQLIQKDYVDTSECDYLGLLPNGYASQCGLEKSRAAVKIWQNTFDGYLIKSSQDTGIPSQLLKRIFAKESQFWPETIKNLYHEFGPGHINELGADTTLFWNRGFYTQFCPLVLDKDVCDKGYAHLDDWSQALLRGAFLSEIEIDLPYRDQRVDPEQAQASVSLFTETILGNCSQVRQLIINEKGRIPGEIVSYEDLWKFTLANYHAGSGCLATAIIEVADQNQSLTWDNISRELETNCPWAVDYVNGIVY